VPANEAERRRRELLRIQRQILKRRRKALVGTALPVLVEGPSAESEFLLQGRHAGQAPEIDGHVFLSLGESAAEADLSLRPGDLVLAAVHKTADYDLAAEAKSLLQAARRPPQAVRLQVVR
jgi:ribosomal protein S12 methylthiotransferase